MPPAEPPRSTDPSRPAEHYDHVFIGSGCAALSLALRLTQSPTLKKQSILLIDPERKSAKDRTWCTWENQASDLFSEIESQSWEKMSFYSLSGQASHSSTRPYRYRMITSDHFYRYVISQLLKSEATQVQDEVVAIDLEQSRVTTASGKTYVAQKMIYNSSEKWSSVERPARYEIWQHFHGIQIQARLNVFDPSRVHFMDFRTPQEQGVSFLYILPESPTTALVEYTQFSKTIQTREFYLRKISEFLELKLKLGPSDYTVLSDESGKIPMSSAEFPLQRSERFLNIGSAGGLTKSSTGYTFSRIQRDSDLILRHLENPATPLRRVRTSPRFRFYDQLFLNLLETSPQRMESIFSTLFQRVPLPRILRFLDEQTHFSEELQIFLKLPWMPFLRALGRHLCGYFKPLSPR